MDNGSDPPDPGFRQHHPTVSLEFGSRVVRVDVELAPVVRLLWRLDIATVACCQDAGEALEVARRPLLRDGEIERRKGRAYIDFADLETVLIVYRAIAAGGTKDQLRDRMIDWCSPHLWEIRAGVRNIAWREPSDSGCWSNLVPGMCQMEFPRKDIPLISDCLANFIALRSN